MGLHPPIGLLKDIWFGDNLGKDHQWPVSTAWPVCAVSSFSEQKSSSRHVLKVVRLNDGFAFDISAMVLMLRPAFMIVSLPSRFEALPLRRSSHSPQRRRLDGEREFELKFGGPGDGQDAGFAMLDDFVALGCRQNRNPDNAGGYIHKLDAGEPPKVLAQGSAQAGFEHTERVRAERVSALARPAGLNLSVGRTRDFKGFQGKYWCGWRTAFLDTSAASLDTSAALPVVRGGTSAAFFDVNRL